MEDNNITTINAPGGTFTRKASYETTRVDTAKLKDSYPAIYQKVAKTSVVKGSISYKPNKS